MTRSTRGVKRYRSKVDPANTVNSAGKKVCGSNTPSGRICQGVILMPNGRCRKHGGKAAKGILAGAYRNGRYVKDLPANLADRYEEAMADTELLSLRKDISLLDSMVTAKLSEIREAQQNPDLEQIAAIVEAMTDPRSGWKTWDWTRTERELARLKESITQAARVKEALREVRQLVGEKAGLITQENRRLVELNQTMTVEEGIALMRLLMGACRRFVLPLPGGEGAIRSIAAEYRNATTVREAE